MILTLFLCTFAADWTGKCVTDDWDRTLPNIVGSHDPDLTPAKCLQDCEDAGYIYAGVEAGHECFCGNDEPPGDRMASEGDCHYNCNGDSSLKCGGAWRLSVYKYGDLGKGKCKK